MTMKTSTIVKLLWPTSILLALVIGSIFGGVLGRQTGWLDARRAYTWDLCRDLEQADQSLKDPDICWTVTRLRTLIWAVGTTSYPAKLADFREELARLQSRLGTATRGMTTAEPPADAVAGGGQHKP